MEGDEMFLATVATAWSTEAKLMLDLGCFIYLVETNLSIYQWLDS